MDEQDRAWTERHRAHLAEVARRVGFNDGRDHADLITRFFFAKRVRNCEERDDPVIADLIERWNKRYAELRHHGFEFADRVATTEAVRFILASPAAQAGS